MSTPNGTGASRRTRTTGLVLLGLAVIAAVIGVVVATGGERTSATGPPPVASPQAPGSASAIPSVIPYPLPAIPSPDAAPDVFPPSIPDAVVDAPPGGASPSGPGVSRGEVRVYNNSTIRGLAARAADDLAAAGWTVVEVGNYPRGAVPTTTAYYQEDTGQRADADALGDQFRMRVEPRFPGIANIGPGLIVIVTNDYVSP
ncbi:MAG: LytR C-terminal domain-containing protein [Pseudonocardiaceae bacterium]